MKVANIFITIIAFSQLSSFINNFPRSTYTFVIILLLFCFPSFIAKMLPFVHLSPTCLANTLSLPTPTIPYTYTFRLNTQFISLVYSKCFFVLFRQVLYCVCTCCLLSIKCVSKSKKSVFFIDKHTNNERRNNNKNEKLESHNVISHPYSS